MERVVPPSDTLPTHRRIIRVIRCELGEFRRAGLSLFYDDRWVTRLVVAFAALQLAYLFWDLPSSFSWDNDGIAPRDLFGGLANNLTPGAAHRYPFLHYFLVGLLSLPALAIAAAVGLLSDDSVRDVVLHPVTMSTITVLARLLSIGMSVGTVLVIARITRRLFDATAARYASMALVCCVCFAWYGRATNLDAPYVFWVVVAISTLLDAISAPSRRHWFRFAVFVACAVATKDQAYAPFVLMGPVGIVAALLHCGNSLERSDVWRNILLAVVFGALMYGVLSGALLNPTGFVNRLKLLTGTNSEDWRLYAKTMDGLLLNASELWRLQQEYLWSWGVIGIAWLGVVRCAFITGVSRRFLPFLGGVSSILFFTLVVGRSEERFMLTFAVLITPYIGAALSYAAEAAQRLPYMSRVVHVVAVLLLAHSGLQVIALGLTQTGDSRVSVERFLQSLPTGTTVETYGLTVYQIRYTAEQAPYRLTRIGPKEPNRRNPLPGVVELKAPYMAVTERAPDVIIVPMAFANRYLRETSMVAGRAAKGSMADLDAQRFFSTAVAGRLVGYQRSHLVDVAFPSWATHLGMNPRRIQSSTGTRNIVLLRDQFEPNLDLSEAIH